ncbi:DNA polymerase III subunit gamma and tau [Streptoalloteichus hindustanus]|uniref:DNA polymerase III subunit gamma/tau n=1 Tax=Streptoalloteichus hindustanus TaxID=2017 RepID=A0A1M4VNU3_STRHI|nr:DNA polymerase III subunit gamma and tau [Streptoalloteichus hindustanus]SHE70545.1 DNA polymerase III, tau subunit [Streptoalloteichus hindustanus]
MALALYRKYRPASFAEVVGQEHVTEPLRTALAAGRINHAYLFSGPRGCGKTSSARILARSLNCERGPTPDPCGECSSCHALAPEGSGTVDVVELDAASHGGVDDARELRDRAFYAPAESRYRVFIIDEAHMVTTQGFNALLKIVEEPPEHLIFIFATTEPDKVLPTIRSRTHHYPFRLIPPVAMRALLERNCAAEGVPVEPAVFPLVIRAGGGSARDTQSVMDQLLAGAGPSGVTYDRAIALLGVTDVALIDDMVDALAAGDGATVFGTVNSLVDAGHDPRRFASDLLDRLRDLVLLRAVPDAAQRGLVEVPDDQLARMTAQAERLGPATLSRFAEILHTGLTEMRGATAPRLLLELLCARMLLPGASDAESALLQRLERLERDGVSPSAAGPAVVTAPAVSGVGVPAVAPVASPAEDRPGRRFERPSARSATPPPAPAPAPVEQPVEPPPAESRRPEPARQEPVRQETPVAPAPPPAPVAPPEPQEPATPAASEGGMDAAAVRRVWPEVLKVVATRNRPTQALLLNATVQAIEGNTLILAMPTAGLARQLAQERRLEVLRAALRDVLNGTWDVQCVHGDPAPAGGATGGNGGRPAAPARPAQPRPAPQRRSAAPPPPERRPEPPRAADEDVPPPPEPPADDIPPPPEPEPEPPMDEEAMLAEADRFANDPTAERQDPEEAAIALLQQHLGAQKIERG